MGSLYDWQAEFHLKNEHLRSVYPEVTPYDFYRDLFPEGITARKDEIKANKGNIIASRFTRQGLGKHMLHCNIGNDLPEKEMEYFLNYKNAYIPPISYFGKSRSKKQAHLMFAVVVDIDLVLIGNLRDLIHQYSNSEGYYYPPPTYIVNSSKGVHLYYLLDEPYKIEPGRSDFEKRMKAIKDLKKDMIRRSWNDYTSIDPDRDAANIWQIFRAVGSKTKFDDNSVVTAFKVCDKKYSFVELKELFYSDVDLACLSPLTKAQWEAKVEEIKQKYPAYYQRVIVEKAPPKRRGCFDFPPQMYYKWVERVRMQGTEGHRYFCIKVLFANAIKCNIPRKEALQDALKLLPILDGRTKEKEPFTKDDVMAAYREAYLSGEDKTDLFHRLPTDWIVENTAIELPKPKRNYRKRREHLQAENWKNEKGRPTANVCKQNRELALRYMRENGEITGRPSAEQTIKQYRAEHPEGKPKDCIEATGLSKNTVYKWWNKKGE